MRDIEEISTTISRFDLMNRESINELEKCIRHGLTINEIEHFANYLHGGIFMSTAEPSVILLFNKIANKKPVKIKWTQTTCGYCAPTLEADAALTKLWNRLLHVAHFSIGAAAVVEMQSANFRGKTFYTDNGDGASLYDMTLDEIAKKIPNGLKDRIERDIKPAVEKAFKSGKEEARRKAQSKNARAKNREKMRSANSQK